MNLGDKVFFIDMDGCQAIRKSTITCVKDLHGYRDFLSSRPHEEYRGRSYTVCAVKDGSHKYFETKNVFETIDKVKHYLAEEAFKKFDVLE